MGPIASGHEAGILSRIGARVRTHESLPERGHLEQLLTAQMTSSAAQQVSGVRIEYTRKE